MRRLTPLAARQATELGRGTDSVAYLVDGEWVFRFPMVPDAQDTLRREIALLPDLSSALPLATPAFEHVGGEDGQLRFVGYRVLAGEPLTANRFDGLDHDAQEEALAALAGFLLALHAFPVDVARRAAVAEEQLAGGYSSRQRDLVRDAAHLLSAAERAELDRAFDEYERDHPPDTRRTVLLHADIKPSHVLYDDAPQRITGVIDWGDVSLGDPDFDLAVIAIFLGHPFLERLLAHLPDRDRDEVLAKTRFFTTLRWLQDVVFDMQRGDHASVESCLVGLREQLA